jgi:hypothetical protein
MHKTIFSRSALQFDLSCIVALGENAPELAAFKDYDRPDLSPASV